MKRFILLIIMMLPATLFAQSISFDDMISGMYGHNRVKCNA